MSPRLALNFLGIPQLYLDGKPITTDRRKAVALFAYLAVDTGKNTREFLSGLLWPNYDQSKAFSNLRRTIWEVHQSIGEGWLIADRESVQLNPDAELDLDVARFRDLLSQGHKESELKHRIALLTEAAKLYRNHFLTGFSLKDAFPFNEWAYAEAEELRHQLADALNTLSEDYCALGQAETAIPHARRLISLDPLNEASHRQLMEVYFQAGQHSAALKQYQICENILRKELNLDPQPETRALYKMIRKGAIKAIHVEEQKENISPKHNLPLQLSSFIGREKEQAEIISLIAKNRLVTLTGAGGIGKTRLSLEAAHQVLHTFPNGVWFIELAPLSDPALVPQAIVNTLGLIEQANRAPQTILTDFLQAKKSLLILDNCEHLIQACAQLAETLLRACPNLHILATSREALGIPGETLYLVPALTTPDPLYTSLNTLPNYEAVQLFVERAQSALAGFMLTDENAPAIARVCRQLDGIPLALELAAARIKMMSLEEIASHLNDRFRLLTGGARTALPRHQTLQAMIDWSYDLLSEPERVLLRRLSVFVGGWSLEAAESVCGGEGIETYEILDLLTQLLSKSLIFAERAQGRETRYRMLETIRQYAREKLWAVGEGDMIQKRHFTYFVELAERAEPNLRAFDMIMWLDRLEIEHDNIRTALECTLESDVEAELRLASALWWFWHIRGHKNEGIDWLERGLSIEAIERGDQPLTPGRAMIRGKALNVVGALMSISFESRKAPERLQESLALFQELGPIGKQGMAIALLRLGALLGGLLAAETQARSTLEQSLALFREIGDKFGVAECLGLLAENVRTDDDYKQAVTLAEQSLALRREIGDQDGIALALSNLGSLAFWQDDYQRAITLYKESLAGFRAVRNKWAIGFTLSGYGDICLCQGDYERATKIYEEALAFAQDLGDRFLIAFNSYNLGAIAWLHGDYVGATQMITDSLAVFRDVGYHWFVASSMHALGDIALAQGDEERATRWYEGALAFGQETQLDTSLVLALDGLGKVAWVKGDYELATQRFEEGLRMSREVGLKSATILIALYGLGRVAQSRGDYGTARAFYTEASVIPRQQISSPLKWIWPKTYVTAVAYLLSAFAAIGVAQNQIEPSPLLLEGLRRAARLLGASETLFPAIRFEMSAAERAEHDQAVAAARAALGEEAFAAAWAEGKAMSLEQAIAYAREANHD